MENHRWHFSHLHPCQSRDLWEFLGASDVPYCNTLRIYFSKLLFFRLFERCFIRFSLFTLKLLFLLLFGIGFTAVKMSRKVAGYLWLKEPFECMSFGLKNVFCYFLINSIRWLNANFWISVKQYFLFEEISSMASFSFYKIRKRTIVGLTGLRLSDGRSGLDIGTIMQLHCN